MSASQFVQGSAEHTLLLSMRRVENIVAYSGCYEFEDVVAEVTGADRVDIDHMEEVDLSRKTYRLARMATGSPQLARKFSMSPPEVNLDHNYELFFPVFNQPYELYGLNTIPNWRQRSRIAACFICEVFVHLLPQYLLELLREFDHIFVGSISAAAPVARVTGRPCTYLPFASDMLKFSPLPNTPARTIDVCNIGRRSEVTHGALVKMAHARQIFYYYDTVASSGVDQKQRTFRVQSASEHRLLLANLLKRSRYYIANRSRANEPDLIKNREEISGRFYEGACAGAVLIGAPPSCPEFNEQFGWQDSVIRVPFDAPDIGDVLADLDRDPARLEQIRRSNIHHAALRHDWMHRLQTVFTTVGLAFTSGMIERQAQLEAIAASAMDQQVEV